MITHTGKLALSARECFLFISWANRPAEKWEMGMFSHLICARTLLLVYPTSILRFCYDFCFRIKIFPHYFLTNRITYFSLLRISITPRISQLCSPEGEKRKSDLSALFSPVDNAKSTLLLLPFFFARNCVFPSANC